jgi:hypothetical protein
MTASRTGRGRPRVSSFQTLRYAAGRFDPPYTVAEESESALRVLLRDRSGKRPDVILRHRHDRRLFFRANYLVVEAAVPGDGPSGDGELRFRFRGPFSRQRGSLRWRTDVPGGSEWTRRLEGPLLRAIDDIQAVESLRILWHARSRTWRLELKTLSGSMVGGFMTAMPIAVPLEPAEARGIVALVDALRSTAGSGHP